MTPLSPKRTLDIQMKDKGNKKKQKENRKINKNVLVGKSAVEKQQTNSTSLQEMLNQKAFVNQT